MLTVPLRAPSAGLPHLTPARDTTRRRLVVGILVWGVLLAAATGAAAVAWESWNRARAGYEVRLRETARTAALTLDAQLSAYEAAARMLAYAPQLQPGNDPASLYAQARAAGLAIGGWLVVIDMTDPAQPQLLNTRARRVEHSLPETLATRARLLQTGRTAVSNLFTPPGAGVPHVMLSVPVPGSMPPRTTVDFVVEASTLGQLLARQQLENGSYALLTDGHYNVVARSIGPPDDVGRHIDRLDQMVLDGDEGTGSGTTRDGKPALFAWRRLAMAPGWLVSVVAPADAVSAVVGGPLRGVLLAGGGLSTVLLLVLAAMWRGRQQDRAAYADLDRVLANVPAAIFVDRLRPGGRRERQFLSRGVARLAGWTWDELRAAPNTVLRLIDPQDLSAFRAYRHTVLERGQGSVEVRLRARDGGWRTLRSEESCFERGPDGSMLVAGCVIDVTDAAAAKARMHQMEKLALLGEVATGIAHEINQPLSAIGMAAENGARALIAAPPGLARAAEKFDLIQVQTRRINTVITHIRSFGRSSGGEVGPIDVARVIADTASLLAGRLRQDRVVLTTDLAEALPKVTGVAVMLEQVVMNLMVNAADAYRAHPDRQPRPLVVRAAVVDGALRITIIDQAGGIPPEMLGRIFDPFFTTKAVGEGTGLGLSISLATVASMGGRMDATNHDNGARFDITLPLPLPTPADPTPAPAGCLMSPGPV